METPMPRALRLSALSLATLLAACATPTDQRRPPQRSRAPRTACRTSAHPTIETLAYGVAYALRAGQRLP
ncbi:MAG: hypothetical protein MZW92_36750 [Comamonadaceae bacterium]|nr:hypothetical protein [Comamonadaceae bacterium]